MPKYNPKYSTKRWHGSGEDRQHFGYNTTSVIIAKLLEGCLPVLTSSDTAMPRGTRNFCRRWPMPVALRQWLDAEECQELGSKVVAVVLEQAVPKDTLNIT